MKNPAKHYLRSLKRDINKMAETPELFVKHPGKDFTRKRKLDLQTTVSFFLTSVGKSLSNELLQFFSCKSSFPTVSAFIQQRDKLSKTAFEELFHSFSDSNIPNRTFKGYRLLAVDGSSLCTPPNPADADSYFPSVNGKKHFNLLHINALYDLCSHTYVDAIAEGGQVFNERTAFNNLVDRSYIKNAIVIADRGYEAFNTFAHCMVKGWYFLIRAKDGSSGAVINGLSLPDSEEYDVPISLVLGRSRSKEALTIPNYKPLASNTVFDFLPASSKASKDISTFAMNFRVVRLQISPGCFEIIITNLPADVFQPEILKKLYSERWGIETSFRHLKKNIGLELVHAKKVESIFHEIFARLIVYNFTALIAYQTSIREKLGKYSYKPSFTNAVLICRQLFLRKTSPLEAEACIARCLTPIRPDRSTPRGSPAKRSACFNNRLA
ncbi:MAG: IS4 family transposase [Roseburia sp.]